MSDKTFKDRVKEEVPSFSDIYAEFKEDLELKLEAGIIDSRWDHLFAAPIRDSVIYEEPTDAMRKLGIGHRHDAVKEALKQLGIDELKLGPIEILDTRISVALDAGLLTPDETMPPSDSRTSEYEKLAVRLKVNHDDPVFWRSLLEILCRALVARPGPKRWSLAKQVELAFDLDEIRRAQPDARWNKKAVLHQLRSREPYATKYGISSNTGGGGHENSERAHASAIGEDRVQKITDLIGPMDDNALERLKNQFPETFFKVSDARSRRKRNWIETLDLAEELGDSLDSGPPSPDK